VPAALAVPVTLTASEHHRLKMMADGHKTEYRLRMRAQVVLQPHADAPTRASPGRPACIWTRSVAGAAGSPSTVSPV
jgi:hypothetical protein